MSKRKKKTKGKRLPWFFLIVVILPTLLASIYYYHYASDQYVSESSFIIQGGGQASLDVLGGLVGLPAANDGASDSAVIRRYLQSDNFLTDILPTIDVRKHFSDPAIDFYARLPADASREDLLSYWQEKAELENNASSGVNTVRMTSFNANVSQQLVILALQQSEALINDLSDEMRSDSLQLAQSELTDAKKNMDGILQELTQFREQQDILDPTEQSTARISREEGARLEMMSRLKGDLAAAEAELAQIATIMRPEALQYKNQLRRVQALRQQIAREEAKTNIEERGRSKQVAGQISQYTELQGRLETARQIYQAKLTALEQARIADMQQQRYLTIIVDPTQPDEAIKPDKASGVLTVFILSFLFWGIGSLSIAAIRDHIGWV